MMKTCASLFLIAICSDIILWKFELDIFKNALENRIWSFKKVLGRQKKNFFWKKMDLPTAVSLMRLRFSCLTLLCLCLYMFNLSSCSNCDILAYTREPCCVNFEISIRLCYFILICTEEECNMIARQYTHQI